jgi:hypothetical protein
MSCFSVKASSVGSLESAADLAAALYSVYESISIAGGIKDGISDYASGKSLYDSFVSSLKTSTMPDYGSFYLEDGTEVKVSDFITDYDTTLTEDAWNNLRDTGVSSALKGFAFTAAFVSAASDYLSSVYAGDVEDVDPTDYIGSKDTYSSYDDMMSSVGFYSGSNVYNYAKTDIWDKFVSSDSGHLYLFTSHYGSSGYYMVCPVFTYDGFYYTLKDDGFCYFSYNGSNSYGYVYYAIPLYSYGGSVITSRTEHKTNSSDYSVFAFSDDFTCREIFYSEDASAVYDYTALAASVPDVFTSLVGKTLSASDIDSVNDAVSVAAASVGTSGAIADNTADYILALTTAISALTLTEAGDIVDNSDVEVKEWSDVVLGLPELLNNIISSLADTSSTLVSWDDAVLGLPAVLSGISAGVDDVNAKLIDWNDILTGLPEFPTVIVKGLTDALPDILSGSLADIRSGVLALPDSLADVEAAALSIPAAIAQELAKPLADIIDKIGVLTDTVADVKEDTKDEDKKDDESSSGSGGVSWSLDGLVYGLFLIILILIQLLKIFLHCLKFIICIFRIPASQGFLPDDMVTGFNYLRTLEITGIGISVFDFMMGLIHIMIIFGIIRLLRVTVDKIHLPHRS